MPENNRVLGVSKIQFGDACFLLYDFNREAEISLPKVLDNNYHQHPFIEIHFITSGGMTFIVEERRFRVEKGQAILITPGHPHFVKTDELDGDRIVISLNMTRSASASDGDEGFFDYFNTLLSWYTYSILTISEALWSKLLRLNRMPGDGDISVRCRYIAAAYDFLTCLMEELNCSRDNSLRKYAPESNLPLMLENMVYDFRYSLPEIAERLGYSRRHVSRLIRQKYGMSLSSLRESIMFFSAKMIMQENPDARFQEILEKSGFMSATALYRAFMKYENCSPSDYRKRVKEGSISKKNGE